MTARPGILGRIRRFFSAAAPGVVNVAAGGLPVLDDQLQRAARADAAAEARAGGTATVEVAPPAPAALRIGYAPDRDGEPDAGEIVWTWVPYDEADGRGKDRPVLVIARQDEDRVYAVRLTSKAHDGDRDYLPIGTGDWDSRGRPSWVDVEQIFSVHRNGMRREAAALELERFVRVADALHRRHGWDVGN
ncbi:type II toxin-antitoxin system PemK/MazF family toxin [Microbacterium sp. CFH 90308]|uniref:Type II toxin-antitoxin system PemK/MazF family toxin n=1 Tax=Microbacterium salsuginis TaxID=2722803 RepID=A0ABX1KEI2_9MICO|nr:type II toxin-antitoxin system PemK/MazF family toxin [Microbacterium sp. CFH 90308]NLP85453.1 type II toxin-antitoxin system PemK/MazF family toxin [Microbacterium sp. CFH 90308]